MMNPVISHPLGNFIREVVPFPEVSFLINSLISIIAICAVAIGTAPILIYMERKLCAHIQCRLGPMRLGFHGTLQTIADVMKLLFKEVYAPKGADKFLFYLAPMISLTAPFLALTMIPFDHNLQVANLSLRSGAQMISYEISFALVLLFVVMVSGSANLMEITQSQSGTILDWWIIKIPVLGFIAVIMFFISSTAELNRGPFDIAEAEQELTGGYHTEYNGTAFAMFYLAEYINLVTTSSLATTCFLGGFLPPLIGIESVDLLMMKVPGFIWFAAKVVFMISAYMVVRWTFVRPRVDQLMDFEWKFLLPANLLLLALGATYIAVLG